MSWQTIDSAPKDRVIIVWSDFGYDRGWYLARWSDYYGAFLKAGSNGHGKDHLFKCTHWRENLEPPVQS